MDARDMAQIVIIVFNVGIAVALGICDETHLQISVSQLPKSDHISEIRVLPVDRLLLDRKAEDSPITCTAVI